jgi:hypothetical protein
LPGKQRRLAILLKQIALGGAEVVARHLGKDGGEETTHVHRCVT